jgi:hypothetical protein
LSRVYSIVLRLLRASFCACAAALRKRFAFTDVLVIICDIIIIVVHFRTHAVCCAARVHAEIAFCFG